MSHLLHERARTAGHYANAAKAEQLYATAACWYEASADAYAELAEHTRPRNVYRAAGLLGMADEAETQGYRAWEAARRAEGVEVPR